MEGETLDIDIGKDNIVIKSPKNKGYFYMSNSIKYKRIRFVNDSDVIDVCYDNKIDYNIKIYSDLISYYENHSIYVDLEDLIPDYNFEGDKTTFSHLEKPWSMSEFNTLKLFGVYEQIQYRKSIDIIPKGYVKK